MQNGLKRVTSAAVLWVVVLLFRLKVLPLLLPMSFSCV